jgi:hypothetical protein
VLVVASKARNFSTPFFVSHYAMFTFLLWCLLFVLCWPLALLALIAYPIVWLILLPFRLAGMAVGGVLMAVWAVVTLPFRMIRKLA